MHMFNCDALKLNTFVNIPQITTQLSATVVLQELQVFDEGQICHSVPF